MNTRTMTTPSTGPRPIGPRAMGHTHSGSSCESFSHDGPSGRSHEDDALVALFAEAGLTVEIVATCSDATCPQCGAARSVGGRGDRLAA